MRPDELERLLWDDAEGALDAAGRERLQQALDAVPEGELRRQQVADFAALLGAVNAVAPPPELRARIDRALAARPQPRPRPTWRDALAAALAPRRRALLAAAATVAVAVAAVLLLADAGRLPGAGDSRYAGALVPATAAPAEPETAVLPGGLGALALSVRDGALVCQLRLDRAAAGGVRLIVTGEGVTATALATDGVSAAPIPAGHDAVGAAVTGVGSLTLAARPARPPQALEVRVDVDGKQVLARRIEIPGEGRR
jgi:hypothetical protein